MTPRRSHRARALAPCAILAALALSACHEPEAPVSPELAPRTWTLPIVGWPAGLLSVAGSAADDVWVVGATHERRPTVLRWRGDRWEQLDPPTTHTLWWVHVLDRDTVFFGGEHGQVLLWRAGVFERLPTPALARQTVFGVWARSTEDVYAVGGVGGRSGFVWHWDGTRWTDLPLPRDLPRLHHGASPALFKVWGDDDEVWVVGGMGQVLRRRGDAPLERVSAEGDDPLFTVTGHPATGEVLAVGGFAGRVDVLAPTPAQHRPFGVPMLQGVAFDAEGRPWASGARGALLRREADAWVDVDPGLTVPGQSLHAVWVDPEGGVWAVGGDVLSASLRAGVLLHGAPRGRASPSPLAPPSPPVERPVVCPDSLPDLDRRTVARVWHELALDAIRRALPEPTVHARNLYHLSLALHDGWAAFEPDEPGLVADTLGDPTTPDARRSAMSHAAFRLLVHRYAEREGGPTSVACFRRAMVALDLDPDDDGLEGDAPSALGNRIGHAIIAAFANDGSRETDGYADPDYRYANPSLRVDEPGIDVDDVDTWQPLDLAIAITQNGIRREHSAFSTVRPDPAAHTARLRVVPDRASVLRARIPEASGPQRYIGPHWGGVIPFAIRRPEPRTPYFDAGPAPSVTDPEMSEWIEEVLRRSAELDVDDGVEIDISPGALGNNPLGRDDGAGHALNPHTGEAYAPQRVLRGDFGRVLAEHWADGPRSETPPGHWNVLAHALFDHPSFERRWMGEGDPLEPLTWDVRALLVLNGALHDAAIVAWEVKRSRESARPVSLVRWMAARGQRSDPSLPSYDPLGLPLVDGLVEVITEASSRPGERHARLAAHAGELAIWSWPGDPGDPERQRSPLRWVRAAEWMPYQPRTFVTPAFPGFVSGHSTFSRAAADVLSAITGSPFVPGGLGQHLARRHAGLELELGPSADVRLEWATWQDAADQAGQSRIWGGIHIRPDDHVGRVLGARVAAEAVAWARARHGGAGARPGVPFGTPEDVPTTPLPEPEPAFPAPIGGEPGGDAALGVGTGRSGFEALRHGDPLRWEAGVQGGHHVWVSAAAERAVLDALTESERRDVRTRFTLTRRDDDVLADLARTGGYRETTEGWALWGSFAILRPGVRPHRLDGEPLRLEVSLELPGRVLRRTVWVRSECCD